jgi:hypothetical protein
LLDGDAWLVKVPALGYPGGMVSHFTAKVSRGQIAIRDVRNPDGAIVDVGVTPGGWVETAKVSRGQIVLRDVETPEGTVVEVDVTPTTWVETPWGLMTPEAAAGIREAEAELRRGEGIPGEKVIAELRELDAALRRGVPWDVAFARLRRLAVEKTSRRRAKPAPDRARKSVGGARPSSVPGSRRRA